MFTKEKLKIQIKALRRAICCTKIYDNENKNKKAEENFELLVDLLRTLEQMYATITSDVM